MNFTKRKKFPNTYMCLILIKIKFERLKRRTKSIMIFVIIFVEETDHRTFAFTTANKFGTDHNTA